MNYEEALKYITETALFGSKPGLERIRRLLDLMGNPQNRLKFVHVAGTNGKGSTTAMTASILRRAGYKTGMYISPYIEDFRERIQVDGAMIEKEELAAEMTRMLPLIESMGEKEADKPTEFEIITALALSCFDIRKCDIVVLEVGLGGRLDATNIIDAPLAAVITSISLDHTQYLGDTVAAIAAEKCGIIKSGSDAVIYPACTEEANKVIMDFCAARGAAPHVPDLCRLRVISEGIAGTRAVFDGLKLDIPLPGYHQVLNATVAVTAARILAAKGFDISDSSIEEGIRRADFGGRLEIVLKNPLALIDGAHNPDGIAALCRTIDSLFPDRRLIAVMGMLADKEYEYCIAEIAKRSAVFIATRPASPRALEVETAAACARRHCLAVAEAESAEAAAGLALTHAKDDGVILACGSLYMIGEVKKHLIALAT